MVAVLAPAILPATTGGNTAYHNLGKGFADIQDSNECRCLALAEIDTAPSG
jgi:hypothetical protein